MGTIITLSRTGSGVAERMLRTGMSQEDLSPSEVTSSCEQQRRSTLAAVGPSSDLLPQPLARKPTRKPTDTGARGGSLLGQRDNGEQSRLGKQSKELDRTLFTLFFGIMC